MSDLEDIGIGRRVKRGPDGTFEKVVLDPEVAREMGKKSHSKRRSETSDTLLEEAGYDPNKAPEHLRLLAEIAGSQRSGSVAALKDFRRLTREDEPAAPNKIELQIGELCAACGLRYYPLSRVSQEDLIRLAEALEGYKSQQVKEEEA